MLLAELTWPEVRDRAAAGAVLAVPLGSTEQHGPHLPLSTDTDVAVALCAGLAAARPDVLVAPPLAFGSSGEHAGFAGTLSIGQAALEHVVVELGRSAADTFTQTIFVSGHGGNAHAVARAVTTLRRESRAVALFFPRWDGDAHAGHVETSLQLALDPTRVQVSDAAPGNTRPVDELMPAMQYGGVRAVSANGVLGDPTRATADDGTVILARLVADLVAHVDMVFPASRAVPKAVG